MLKLGEWNATLLILHILLTVAHLERLSSLRWLQYLHLSQLCLAILHNLLLFGTFLLPMTSREWNATFLHAFMQLSDEGRIALLVGLRRR